MTTRVRRRAADRLVRTICEDRHPSHQMLDRLEGALRTRKDLEAYAWILERLMEGQRYPSPRMLERLDRCALAHELVAPAEDHDDKDEA